MNERKIQALKQRVAEAAEKARTGIDFIVIGPGLKMRRASWRDRLMEWALR